MAPRGTRSIYLAFFALTTLGQNIRTDPVKSGPPLEIVHLYNGQWPTGIAVSSSGRKFSCFPAGLDMANTFDGLNGALQVQELTGMDTETAYPNATYNHAPGGSVDYKKVMPPFSASKSLLCIR